MAAAITDSDDFVLVESYHGEPEQGDVNVPLVNAEDLEKIRSWLSATSFDSEGSEYQKHLKAHVPDTGDWLFQTDEYKNWHESGSGALWIRGIPGSGKSVIAANLIRTLKDENAPVLFFFSRRIIESNSKPQNLIRDCLSQFLDHSILLQTKLMRTLEQNPLVESIPFHELWRMLLSTLSTVPKVYIIFDALDELAVEEDDFLESLLELGKEKPNSVKLIITSRQLPHLQMALTGTFPVNIRLTERRVEKDITTYVAHWMSNQQEKIFTAEEQSAIQLVLCQKSRGLFLYARLMLDEILQQSVPVYTRLQSLPSSLEDMYVGLLHENSSRSGASIHFQALLLSWVTHACRPLRVTEIAALIASHSDRGGLTESQDTKQMVRTSCGPLLEILDDGTTQIIHHSFTEFLLDSSRSSARETTGSENWFPAFTPALVHRSLTLSCVDYLLSGCFESWSTDERPIGTDDLKIEDQRHLVVRFHFLQYALQNVLYHAALCDAPDKGLLLKLDRFFQHGSHEFECWKDFLFSKKDNITRTGLYPLHIAAQAGLTAYAVHLLDRGETLDLVDSHGITATAYAALYGHAETLAALLSHNASFLTTDSDGLAPIHHAAKGNHVKALKCLLDAGADPLSPKSNEDQHYYGRHPSTVGKTPLQYACELGSADAVSELLKRLDLDLRNTVLPHWASVTGQAKVLSTLLQYPEILSNINKKDECGNSALHLAACIRDPETVRILLQHGADVNLRSDGLPIDGPVGPKSVDRRFGGTPLQGWACFRGRGNHYEHHSVEEWEETGQLLIEAGCDVEERDEQGQTLLFAWTEQLHYVSGDSDRTERFVSLLLNHGANPRATDKAGNTPLHKQQGWYRKRTIVGPLTRAGADINHRRDGDLKTPLIAAAQSQCVDVRAYIDNGADPNMQDSDGNTALHHICKSWLFEFSHANEWLTFADPTIKNNEGNTCIYNLRFGNQGEGRVKAISLMLEKGLDLESRNRLGRTALLAACQNAQPHFINGLIRYGANARSKDFQNKSCLHMIAKTQISKVDHGPKDIKITSDVIKRLIEAGADINDVDFDGNTAFHDAVESSGHVPSIEIMLESILECGGVANTCNHRGQTALHKVAEHKGSSDVIDFLLRPSLRLDLRARDNQGVLAIHCAASASEVITWKFVQAGAAIYVLADDGRSPLHFAAGAAQSNVIGLLCKSYREKDWPIDQKDETGRTALHYAASSGNSESVYYLLQFGANPNIKDNQGMTPLHAAAEHHIDAPYLRKQRKCGNLNYFPEAPFGMAGMVPFMDVSRDIEFLRWKLSLEMFQQEEAGMIQDVVRLLLSAGADLAVRDKSGQTAYDVAVLLRHEEVADVLSHFRQGTDTESPLAELWCSVRTTSAEQIVRSISIERADAYTLIQTAIYLRNEAVLEALLRAGVDPTAVGPDALSPVHAIARCGLVSMMKIVASHVKDLNIFSPPLLHLAASREQSNIQMVKLLIELGVNVSASYQDLEMTPRRWGSPIPSYAAAHILAMGSRWWNTAALKSLCEAGADLEMTDADGSTVLQCALNGTTCWSLAPGFWRDETLEVLLGHGAKLNAISPTDGLTPLKVALESGRCRKLIQRLLDCGADITLGEVPALILAIEGGNLEGTAAIIDAGADVNATYHPKEPEKHGRHLAVLTPLLSAAVKDGFKLWDRTPDSTREAIVALLIERGANPLTSLHDGATTVLHEIASHCGIIEPILKANIDLEIRDSQGRTPFLTSCSPSSYTTFGNTRRETNPRSILLSGANIHATDNSGNTALHLATKEMLEETVTMLLQASKASISAKNNAGQTPLHISLSVPVHFAQTQLRITKSLLSAGADPLSTGPKGETALHLLAPILMQLSPGSSTSTTPNRDSSSSSSSDSNTNKTDSTDLLSSFKSLYAFFISRGLPPDSRDSSGNTPLFAYVREVKHQDYNLNRVERPAEADIRDMFALHDVFAVNSAGDGLLHAVAARRGSDDDHDGEGCGNLLVRDDGGGSGEKMTMRPDFTTWLFHDLTTLGLDPARENASGLSALDVAALCGNEGILGLFGEGREN